MSIEIYALTDSHQESRNLSLLLSGIYNLERENNKQFFVFDAGDLFKGIYDKELSVSAYIKLKELLPQAQIFITIGNNDFGFKKSDFEYLKNTVKMFEKSGINVVCANITDNKTCRNADWICEYKLIEINGQRVLITGFCLNNSCAKKFGYTLEAPENSLINLLEKVQEPFDKLIVLNHHWLIESKNLCNYAKSRGIKIDLIIGGHEHSPMPPDFENNIYYPLSFARAMYNMKLGNEIKNVRQIQLSELNFIDEFEQPIINYERETKLKEVLAKRVLNLPKKYSDPCPLGTFISDKMKEAGNTEIAFHSTGFTMYPLKTSDSTAITKYDLLKVMCSGSTIEKISLTTEQLVQVFEHASSFRMFKDRGNARFIQCSQNIKITGCGKLNESRYKILQIEINGEKLLDENAVPTDKNKKYTCTIDSYIGSGEQGFEMLKVLPKTKILKNGKELKLNDLFFDSVIQSNNDIKSSTCVDYPCFEWIDNMSL